MRIVLAIALCGLAPTSAAAAQGPDVAVVVARVAQDAGPWPACGRLAVAGEIVFETIRVESGGVSASRFVAVVLCPRVPLPEGRVLRLSLRSVRRRRSIFGRAGPPDLPRFEQRSAELAEAPPDAGALLGRRRAWMTDHFHYTRSEGDWRFYGDVLAARYNNDRVVQLRMVVPEGLNSCAEVARWAGFADAGPPLRRAGGCEWPAGSARHALAPDRSATMVGGTLTISQGAPRSQNP